MGMYRDSVLGLCIDITGPDGNVFYLLGIGDDLSRQLDCEADWKGAITAAKLMGGEYMTMVNLFRQFFPVVTLIGLEEISDIHNTHQEVVSQD